MATLTFLGAAKEVTGSCHLLETANARILLDCGMHQGGRKSELRNEEPFVFDPHKISAVVLSHGHLDHSGLLPKLVRDGFKGPIYTTDATKHLLAIMLKDAVSLYLRDIDNENKRLRRAGRKTLKAHYDLDDVKKVLKLCVGVPYHKPCKVSDDVSVNFYNAGHILGSAIVEISIHEPGESTPKKLVFSGDLGNSDSVLMPPCEFVEHADVVMMESTYGDRDHRDMSDTREELAQIFEQAHRDGGNVLIPAFAVGRAQEMLYYLTLLNDGGKLPQEHIFLDSPMAIEVTELYRDYINLLDPEDVQVVMKKLAIKKARHQQPNLLPQLTLTPTTEESMAINQYMGRSIIVAGSGMCNGGRITHHLKHNLWRSECHVIFPGYQANGTLGRMLVDGAKRVKIFGAEIAVKAKIHTLGGFSAHAGQTQLVDWASRFQTPARFYLVHGEESAQQALQTRLKQQLHIDAEIPGEGTSIKL